MGKNFIFYQQIIIIFTHLKDHTGDLVVYNVEEGSASSFCRDSAVIPVFLDP